MRGALTVAGIEVEVRAPQGPLEAVLLERYAPFLGATRSPACRVWFEPSGAADGDENPPMADVDGGAGRHVHVDHVDFTAELDLEGDGKVVTAANALTVDHFLRVLFALLAPRHRATMLHACGVMSDGRAGVFAVQSGAGKSTLASLAGTRPLLSDEHVMVRELDGAWVAASTPFWGSYAKPGPARVAPLSVLFELSQWPRNQIRPLDRAEGLRVALEHAVMPSLDPDVRRAVFDVSADLAGAVDAAQLCFTPNESVWELVDARVA